MSFRSTKGASKQRRDQINALVSELREHLPVADSTKQRLSQLQVMSLVCVYVRKSIAFANVLDDVRSPDMQQVFFQSLPGFVLVINKDGKLVFISENVTDYLGHSMVDMMTQGDTLWDIVDQRDHADVQERLLQGLGGATDEPLTEAGCATFFCRMNVARTLRRQSAFKELKVMTVRGRFVPGEDGGEPLFMALCSPLVTPELKDSALAAATDLVWMEHGPDMKILDCSPLAEPLLGYTSAQLAERSWYELLHPADLGSARDKHVQVLQLSHEYGVMLTARLQTAAGLWQPVSSALCMHQPTPDAPKRIISMHALIRAGEEDGFALQCDNYTRVMSAQYSSVRAASLPLSAGLASPPVDAAATQPAPRGSWDSMFVCGGDKAESPSPVSTLQVARKRPAYDSVELLPPKTMKCGSDSEYDSFDETSQVMASCPQPPLDGYMGLLCTADAEILSSSPTHQMELLPMKPDALGVDIEDVLNLPTIQNDDGVSSIRAGNITDSSPTWVPPVLTAPAKKPTIQLAMKPQLPQMGAEDVIGFFEEVEEERCLPTTLGALDLSLQEPRSTESPSDSFSDCSSPGSVVSLKPMEYVDPNSGFPVCQLENSEWISRALVQSYDAEKFFSLDCGIPTQSVLAGL